MLKQALLAELANTPMDEEPSHTNNDHQILQPEEWITLDECGFLG